MRARRRSAALRALCIAAAAATPAVDAHGQMVYPRPRNSIDAFANVSSHSTWPLSSGGRCSNITGEPCNNGQSAFWYVASLVSNLIYNIITIS